MDEQKPTLTAALRQLAERERRSLKDHPTPEDLASYHAGELPPEAEARLREHLSVCHECSDLLLDLIHFSELTLPPGVPELTDQEVEQDWQALRKRMGEGEREEKERSAVVVPFRPPEPQPAPERRYSPLLAVAASLLAVLGFSFGIYKGTQASRLSQPRIVPVVYGGDIERGPEGPRISSENGGLIHLAPGPEKEYPEYEVEISREDEGKVLFRQRIGRFDESAPLMIPPGFLKPGSYNVRLYGIEGGKKELSSNLPFEANDS